MELALAFPYSLGLVAAFNPCGFVLLPTYLAFFLGRDQTSAPRTAAGETAVATESPTVSLLSSVVRAIGVGLTLTAGFIAVFGVFGVLFETILSQGTVLDRAGYATIVIGIGMAVLGVIMLFGKQINIRLPKLSRGTDGRGLLSMFLFGVSYAVVSLSCTIGLFIAATAATFTDQGFADGVANFVAYGVGMGSVIIFLTLAVAMAQSNVVNTMRRVLPWVNRISGLMLVAAAVYLVNYGWWELQLLDDPTTENAFVEWFIHLNGDINQWINDVTPHRIGVICAFAVAGAVLLGWRQVEERALLRRIVTSAYVAAWLIVEFGFNRAEFLVLPAWRFVSGWPARMVGWFTDPLRFGVICEIAVTALVVWLVGRRIWRWSERFREPDVRETSLTHR